MARRLRPQANSAYGSPEGLTSMFPSPIVALRAPLTTDLGYPIGQRWINTAAGTAYTMTGSAAGAATWALSSPGASDVDTINSLPPVAGDILIDGGTNITDVNAGNTVTLNLDAAITLATSVTSPLYTSAAALDITAPAGSDITIQMGDAAGANIVEFEDSASAVVGSIDSDGYATFVGIDGLIGSVTPAAIVGTTVTGNTSVITQLYTAPAATDLQITSIAGQDIHIQMGDNAGANYVYFDDSDGAAVFSLDSNGDFGALAGLTVAGGAASINDNSNFNTSINTGTSTGTVVIGSANAGVVTADSGAGISLDAALASNFTVTGASEDLTLGATGGSINITATEAAADAIVINASDAGSGMTLDCGTSGFSLDSTGTSNITVTAAGLDLSLQGVGGAVNMTSTQAENDAIYIEASAANGGVQILAGSGGIRLGDQADCTGITIGNIAPTANRNITIGSGTVVTAAVTDTINVGTGGATTNANSIKTVNINTGGVAVGQVLTHIASGAVTSGTHTTNIATGARAAGTMALNLMTGTGVKNCNLGNADGLTVFSVNGAIAINTSVNQNTTIGVGTSTGDIYLGNALAGVITLDTAAGISLDAATASNFTVSSAGEDLTLASTLGSVAITSGEAVATAIVLNASAGGLTADAVNADMTLTSTGGSVTLVGTEAAVDAIAITASDAAGGITMTAGTTGITLDSGIIHNYTEITTAGDSPYSVLGTDYFIGCDSTGGALAVTLPAAPEVGRTYVIYDVVGQAAIGGNVTITGNAANIAAGGASAATYVLNTAYESIQVTWTGTLWAGRSVV